MKSLSIVLSVVLVLTSSLHAGPTTPDAGHPVSIGELRDQVSARADERASNVREVQTLLRLQEVKDHLGRLYDLEKVAVAVPKLDDETLAELARESRQMKEQFRAGVNKTAIWVVAIVAVTIVVIWVVLAKTAEDVAEQVLG